ncbi:MAG: PEP-CTERM-box response regulator transcription factor [bacterium]|nr:PEP-CTERM-box response regulator transcription factor [bacterium]MDT8366734.1 PEP-CTERM-box response regulator transcription factor [bacterium]
MTDKNSLLIIDDDEDLRKQMKWGLGDEYEVYEAGDRDQALGAFQLAQPLVLTLDLGLPPDEEGVQEGFTILEHVLESDPAVKVIIITGRDEKKHALEAIGHGAYDFISKPVHLEDLRIILKRAFKVARLEKEYWELRRKVSVEGFEGMLGDSPQMGEVYDKIRKVATTEVPVLVVGESGTGKELAARAIHGLSLRREGPFVPINCGAIPENLLESELFGHEKGSFTGAHVQRVGRIEMARGGTLFLDEIGELPLALQVKLLRFLQDQNIERVGGRQSIHVDTRVVAATNRDLQQSLREESFREDLYYRLSVVTITIPPLRERVGDILLLANAFLRNYLAAAPGKKKLAFSTSAVRAMESYSWPGNIREMENRVKRAVIMAESLKVQPGDLELGSVEKQKKTGRTLKETRESVERELILETMNRRGGNLSQVARDLDVSRPALYDLLKKLCINKDEA